METIAQLTSLYNMLVSADMDSVKLGLRIAEDASKDPVCVSWVCLLLTEASSTHYSLWLAQLLNEQRREASDLVDKLRRQLYSDGNIDLFGARYS